MEMTLDRLYQERISIVDGCLEGTTFEDCWKSNEVYPVKTEEGIAVLFNCERETKPNTHGLDPLIRARELLKTFQAIEDSNGWYLC